MSPNSKSEISATTWPGTKIPTVGGSFRLGCVVMRMWTEKLKCPKCGKVGEARLSQAELYAFLRGDNKTSLDFLSEGFSSVGEGMAVAFNCTKLSGASPLSGLF
jgi:hypothetical protein